MEPGVLPLGAGILKSSEMPTGGHPDLGGRQLALLGDCVLDPGRGVGSARVVKEQLNCLGISCWETVSIAQSRDLEIAYAGL